MPNHQNNMKHTARHLARQGRNGDSVLVHMSPGELAGLKALAYEHGTEMTINPITGLPEAFKLKKLFKKILAPVLGIAGSFFGIPPWMTAAAVGAATKATGGSWKEALLAAAASGLSSAASGQLGAAGRLETGAGKLAEGAREGITDAAKKAVSSATLKNATTESLNQLAQTGAKQGIGSFLGDIGRGIASSVTGGVGAEGAAGYHALKLGAAGLGAGMLGGAAPGSGLKPMAMPKSKYYVGKGKPLWRQGTWNPDTGKFEGQGFDQGVFTEDPEVAARGYTEDDDTMNAYSGGRIRGYADGGDIRAERAADLADVITPYDAANLTGLAGINYGSNSYVNPTVTNSASVPPATSSTYFPISNYQDYINAYVAPTYQNYIGNYPGNTVQNTSSTANPAVTSTANPAVTSTANPAVTSTTVPTGVNFNYQDYINSRYFDPDLTYVRPGVQGPGPGGTGGSGNTSGGNTSGGNTSGGNSGPGVITDTTGVNTGPDTTAGGGQDTTAGGGQDTTAGGQDTLPGTGPDTPPPVTPPPVTPPPAVTTDIDMRPAPNNLYAYYRNYLMSPSGGQRQVRSVNPLSDYMSRVTQQLAARPTDSLQKEREGKSASEIITASKTGNKPGDNSGGQWTYRIGPDGNLIWAPTNAQQIESTNPQFDLSMLSGIPGLIALLTQYGIRPGTGAGQDTIAGAGQDTTAGAGQDTPPPNPPTLRDPPQNLINSEFWKKANDQQKLGWQKARTPQQQQAYRNSLPADLRQLLMDYNKRFTSGSRRAAGGAIKGYAAGGTTYAAAGKLLQGPGDGMSDSIPAVIQGNPPQKAALGDGEFVIPADVVSDLGNGSTGAGAKQLYAMMDRVRKVKYGRAKQPPAINPRKYLPA